MPSDTIVFRLVFPTWDTLDNNVKSLINFYIDNAQLYISGKYAGNQLLYISGNVINSPRIVNSNDVGGSYPEQYSLNIAYSNESSDNLYPLSVENNYRLLPDLQTSLLRVTSSLQLCHYILSSNNYIVNTSQVNPITLPVTIIPLVNGVENEDSEAVPTDLLNNNTMYGFVNTGLESENTLIYNFQLRTASFTLQTYSYTKRNSSSSHNGYTDYHLFYKIGLCPFDYVHNRDLVSTGNTGKTIEELEHLLMQNYFNIFCAGDSGITGFYFSLLQYSVMKEKEFGSLYYSTTYFPNTFILPIIDNNLIYGIAYIKLYNDSGDAFTGFSYNDEGVISINDSTILHLGIIDYDIDGGYIDNSTIYPLPNPVPENESGFVAGTFIESSPDPDVSMQDHILCFEMLDERYANEYNGIAFVLNDCYLIGIGKKHYEGILRFTNGYATSPYQGDWLDISLSQIDPYVYVNPSFINSNVLSSIFVSGTRVETIPSVNQQGYLIFTMRDTEYAFSYNGEAFITANYYDPNDDNLLLFSYEGLLKFINGEAIGPLSSYSGSAIGATSCDVYINPVWNI